MAGPGLLRLLRPPFEIDPEGKAILLDEEEFAVGVGGETIVTAVRRVAG